MDSELKTQKIILVKYEYKAPFNAILLRYSEIGLKGNNRRMFEDKLLNNIRKNLQAIEDLDFYYERGRLALIHGDESPFTEDEMKIIRVQLGKVFGLESYSPGFQVDSDWEVIRETIEEHLPGVYKVHNDNCKEGEQINYRTRARRSYKKFPYTSNEIEIIVAEEIMAQWDNIKINLSNPDVSVGIEVREEATFIFFETLPGIVGLPVGSSDKVLCLMSGGIDSPVACFQAMKRGSHIDFITFHSHPYTSKDGLEKIGKLINILDDYQDRPGRYFACNLVEAQKEIRDKCEPRLRTVLYRRMMMRIASVLARAIKTRALLTGESMDQVASQTMKNMDCINRATDMLVLRPLISFDKNETIAVADKIGTLETSNIPAADSCTTFAPKKPATNANMYMIEKSEANLDMESIIKACLEDTVLIDQETMEEEPFPKLLKTFDKYFTDHWKISEQ